MYNVLQNTFDETMKREGITVTTFFGNQKFKAFFRIMNERLNQRDSIQMFYPVDAPIHYGSIITLNGKQFIILNQETIENTVYYKSSAFRCNGTISTNDAKVMNLPFYGSGSTAAFHGADGFSTQNLTVISGQTNMITEDCELSRKLEINDLFNAYGRTWQIQNIFRVDGMVTLAVEVQTDHPVTYNYDIQFTDIDASGYKVGDTVSLNAAPTINGNITDGTLKYRSSNISVARIDQDGVISFVGSGSVHFIVTWSEQGISKETTETTIEEDQTDHITLSVSKMDDIYLGILDGECTVTIKRDGEIVHDIAYEAIVTDCDFADRIELSANPETGLITTHIEDSMQNITKMLNKRFTLLVSVPEYGLRDSQSVLITSL